MMFKIQPPAYFQSKRKNSTKLWARIKNEISWYCQRTSLHGLQYIANENSSIFTRIFFACVIFCSLILCIYLIVLQMLEHKQQTIMTTVKSTAYPVWKVRFPSVVICNFNVVLKDSIEDVIDDIKLENMNNELFMDILYNLSSLITNDDVENMSAYGKVIDKLDHIGYTSEKLMKKLSQPCGRMIKKCWWQSKEIDCLRMFKSAKTSQGYCCAFNYYGAESSAKILQNSNFQYVGGAGPTLGLQLLLDVEESQYISSIKSAYGVNVLVQDGADYPDMDLIANTLLTAEELTISVTPRIYDSSDKLRKMSPEQRRCLFEDEGKLEWSAVYSYKTCISECRARAIFEYCNCVPYYYPVKGNIRFCTMMDVLCLRDNEYKYSALGLVDGTLAEEELQKMKRNIGHTFKCECFPQCNERMFDFHVDKAKAAHMMGHEYSNTSVLNVYYNTVGCIKTERDIYYTWDRVLASIGGIFGLCLGGSIISILECLYLLAKSVADFYNVPSPKVNKPKTDHKVIEGPLVYHTFNRKMHGFNVY